MARKKNHSNNSNHSNTSNCRKANRQKTINDIYMQLGRLVDSISENRHIETMEAFYLCQRMLTGATLDNLCDEDDDDTLDYRL